MIGTVINTAARQLARSRVELVVTFVVPILFFSIFALIFGGQGGKSATPKVKVVVVDEDRTETSEKLIRALAQEKSLRMLANDEGVALIVPREEAERIVREGDAACAIVLPKGFEQAFGSFAGDQPAVILLADSSDPVAPQMIGGLLQKVAMTAAPGRFVKGGLEQLEKWGGPLTEAQRQAVETWLPQLETAGLATDEGGEAAGFTGLVAVEVVDLLGEGKKNPVVSFYAAAIAVMFLLFSAVGAGGALIEEEESGTLERLLATRLSMGQLLFGKLVFLTMIGVAQVVLMFTWGQLVFGVDLTGHIPGFAIMTVATAAAAAALGLVFATACRTRGQLHGISTIVILTMSALGGSMVPRFIMSETLQKIGLLTFNAWALDGYVKVFWREAPLLDLWPQVSVLVGLTIVFWVVARRIARRWEIV